jgi:F-type H+-transporting ATPase subunit gamma
MNFRQVRKKIKTVSNVKQITKAMQMVASVKMKKAQEIALDGKVYRQILDTVVKRVLKKADTKKIPFLTERKDGRKLYILISSNKGLSGGFNFNLFKLVMNKVDFTNADFIVLGKKGVDFVSRTKSSIIADFSQSTPFIDAVSPVFTIASNEFINGAYSSVYLIYNSFVSTIRQEPTIKKLFPISEVSEVDFIGQDSVESKDVRQYVVEPSFDEVLVSLINDYLQDKIRGAILESEAAEHSARMMAMKAATDNATDLIFNLTLLRNKVRQTAITNELLDITTAQLSSEGL